MSVQQFDPNPAPLSARHTRWFEPGPTAPALPDEYTETLIELASRAGPLGAIIDLVYYDKRDPVMVYIYSATVEEVYPQRQEMLVWGYDAWDSRRPEVPEVRPGGKYHNLYFDRIVAIRLTAKPLSAAPR